MASPLEKTFHVLARSRDPGAGKLLLRAFCDAEPPFNLMAITAISQHESLRLKVGLIRRVDSCSTAQKDLLRTKTKAFAEAVDYSLKGVDDEARRDALRWIDVAEDFERVPSLIHWMLAADQDVHHEVFPVIGRLVDRLHDYQAHAHGRPPEGAPANLATLVEQTVHVLNDTFHRREGCPRPETFAEWILILGKPDGLPVQRLLMRGTKEVRDIAQRALLNTTNPAAMQMTIELLARMSPFPAVLDVWRYRDDPPFIFHVLRNFPRKLNDAQRKNFALLDDVPWLSDGEESLAEIPQELLPQVALMISHLGLHEATKRSLLLWLFKHGDGATRETASQQFELLDRAETHAILRESLTSEDAGIQVWATTQLRSEAVPDAFHLLLDRLDSPIADVRAAARRELKDFNLQRILSIMDTLTSTQGRNVGEILKKIDPDTVYHLQSELTHPVRKRRMAAVRAAVLLGLQVDVQQAIIALLDETDALVRRIAAEALEHVPTPQALHALDAHRDDPSPRVQEAIALSLAALLRQPGLSLLPDEDVELPVAFTVESPEGQE